MDMAKVKLYRDLRAEQDRLGAESAGVKERADEIERELLAEYAEEGLQNVKTDDGATVFLRREVWAAREDGIETPDIIDALKASGLDHYVSETFNTRSLSSYLRDLEKNEEEMPLPLQGVVKPVEKYAIRIRKS